MAFLIVCATLTEVQRSVYQHCQGRVPADWTFQQIHVNRTTAHEIINQLQTRF